MFKVTAAVESGVGVDSRNRPPNTQFGENSLEVWLVKYHCLIFL